MNARFSPRNRHPRQGMVLLEVIMALLVFTIVAFSLVEVLDSSFNAALSRNEIDVAVRGLNNQLALLHGARLQPQDLDLPDDGSGYTSHLSVTQEQLFDQKRVPLPNMYRATLTVTWKSHGQTEDRSVSELVYQP